MPNAKLAQKALDQYLGKENQGDLKFATEGICAKCKFVRGKCSNKYIPSKNIGPILYCKWYRRAKQNRARQNNNKL